ncbi:hypothetical protein BH10PSE7_BH10PSE7_39730 [soil metagenome]
MSEHICLQCGAQYPAAAEPPARCIICEDERQYVRWDGQAWTTPQELRAKYRNRLESDAGVLGIGMSPSFAIGQRALLAETPEGNVLWDCVPLVTDEAVMAIRARGGVVAIAISHPHYYSSLVQWSEALGGVPVYLQADDRAWVTNPHSCIVHWAGEILELCAGITLIRCGGHFAGGTVLHWRGPAGDVLLSGDILQVTMDRRHVSFMYSYPNNMPLGPAAINRIMQSLEPFEYQSVLGAFWGRNLLGDGKNAVATSAARYLAVIRI